MAGRKRTAEDTPHTTRASKVVKADTSATSPAKGSKGAKKASKPALAASAFKSRALPIHANITHTPPSIEGGESETAAPVADVGAIGTLTLVPTTFSTGSYGWKASKRVTIELQGGDESGDKEKVQVMLTFNATVVGSKQADKEPEGNEPSAPEEVAPGEHKDEEAKDHHDDENHAPEDDKTNGD